MRYIFLQTKLLEAILMKDYGGEEDSLLGELQFAFVAFMVCVWWHVFPGKFIALVFSLIVDLADGAVT